MAKDKKSKKAAEDADEDMAEPAHDHNDGKNDKAKKKKKKGAQDDDEEENGAPREEAKAPVIEEEDEDDAGGKKGKKKRRKRRDDDDEDLEKALAELQLEHEGKKPVGEAKEAEADEAKPKEGKKKEKAKKKEETAVEETEGAEESTVKSAAQKRKEKKERQKQKPKSDDPKETEAAVEVEAKAGEPQDDDAAEDEGDDDKKKKKKKKGKEEKEDDKKKGKKPNKMMVAAMQEALRRVQEEEEKARLAEEEKQRKLEEAQQALADKKRLEEERRALRKQREKEKKEELRKAGLLLTAKQKADKARAEAMLEAMRAQGVDVPLPGEKRGPRPGTRVRTKKGKGAEQKEGEDAQGADDDKSKEEEEEEPSQEDDAPKSTEDDKAEAKASWEDEDEEEDVKDSWDAEDEVKVEKKPPVAKKAKDKESEAEESEEESSSEESDSDDSEDSDESEDDSGDERDETVKVRETALARISARKEENEKKRTTDVLRAPVVCVLGHVDTGKTKILDKLRRTHVQDNEAGGITQQIGATNVPIEVIKEQCKMVKNFAEGLVLPGLLIIDTPGHESFSNLRDRGSSLCDIAILVVDIMHCLEPQTIESINLLKKKKTPFVIALNKIDRLYEWKSNRHKDVQEVIDSQTQNTKLEFVKRSQEVITAMAEQGLNAALFYENPDPKTYISMVPTSAHSGDGMGNLMGLLVQLSQTMLAKRLAYSDELQATVLEVKAIPGLGTTIDIVLVNGTIREGQTMVLAGTDGAIVTQIRSLLTPAKMQDLRVKSTYIEHKELKAAQGVKIAAKDLDKAIAGLNLLVAHQPDEVEVLKEEIESRLQSALTAIKLTERGVFVQASTLGSLEALLEFLKTSKIPYAGVKIGPVVKRDVMKASVMLEHEEKYTVILAFDVKVERDAQDMADNMGVKIFQADIIYHLFDRFTAYQEELKAKKREEFKHQAVFPCKLRFLPNLIFNSRSPIVAGVVVEAGTVRKGTPLCVPSKEFLEIGIVTSIESNHKEVETAKKGEEVCIKIDPLPGESPKMFGRHFDEKDIVMSKISRTSIDVCKEHFRDDLQKSDWQLMVELKKVFQIL